MLIRIRPRFKTQKIKLATKRALFKYSVSETITPMDQSELGYPASAQQMGHPLTPLHY
ncbi:hypothetical protein VYA_20030 [Vibrio alfacsensis]|nr:hypothetical protein VYA_20030 [Vibrio alfacsensis]